AEALRARGDELDGGAAVHDRSQPSRHRIAGDVRNDDARDRARQFPGERLQRGIDDAAMHGVPVLTELLAVVQRPLDARVADVDERLHHALRTLTSPATTRRRAPGAVSISSAPSASMPSAVPVMAPAASSSRTARPR